MGHAYTPGLKVSAAAEWTRRRLLPIKGEVLVQPGTTVEPGTVVARALLPGNVVTVHLARQLGVSAGDLPELLLAGGRGGRRTSWSPGRGLPGM
jgi:hypothetical protein